MFRKKINLNFSEGISCLVWKGCEQWKQSEYLLLIKFQK